MLWEELTADQFAKAARRVKGVCVIPCGVIEKHGNHLPLATDMITVRAIAHEAAKIEAAVIFPYFFFGRKAEPRHVPGTIAYSPSLLHGLFEETCSEIARNGFSKIVLFNAHGGNYHFLGNLVENSLYRKKAYVLYVIHTSSDRELAGTLEKQVYGEFFGNDGPGDHGGNEETSLIISCKGRPRCTWGISKRLA